MIVSASSVDFYATGQKDKHAPLSFGPGVQVYLVSGTSAGIALLAEDRRSHLTSLRVLDESGVERWRSGVRTTPSQPPIDGGPDRIYVAGSALFALEDRREIWRLDDGPTIRATAFADGGLAIARGARLLILDRDGKELGSLTTPDTDLLVTPPALASDGSIWVASATHLYVAR